MLQRFFSLASAVSGLAFLLIFTSTKPAASMSSYRLLSLGDSYTEGEMVAFKESFPGQTCQLLINEEYDFEVEVLAKTGWTTDELQVAMRGHKFSSGYDFVTLLIGVNNQYRGRTVENYKPEFENLLKQAIKLAGEKPDHVIVLSIPDWGA